MNEQQVPKLRFSEFTETWKYIKLKEIFNIYDGVHQTPKYIKKGIPFVSVENINDLSMTKKYISKDDFEKDFKIKPQKNDILMTRITAGIIGATSIVETNNPLAYYVSLALLRQKSKSFSTSFLNYKISSIYFKKELNRKIIHVAFPKKINLGDIGECKTFVTFNFSEQEKIADFLTLFDKELELEEKKLELLKENKKGYMQKIFNQEIRFKDELRNDYPQWEEKKLGEIVTIKKGEQLNKNYLTKQGVYPCLNGGINYSGYTDKYNTPKDTIAISEGGNSCGYVNYIKTKFWSGGHCYTVLDIEKNIDKKNLYFYLKLNEKRIKKMRVGSGLPNIQKTDLINFKISIPSLPEQEKIANFLSTADEEIELMENKIEKLKEIKKGLLQEMFI